MKSEPRPCERQCKECKQWKHHSRFDSWKDKRLKNRNSTVPVVFSPTCRDCEQKARNEIKNQDRPKAIIEQRAKSAATKAGLNFDFVMMQLNYRGLIPILRAMCSDEAICLCCGHKFDGERDIQIEHIEPPRHNKDFARLHARNLRILCGSCNRTKGKKPYSEWLDDQEGARISNLAQNHITEVKNEPMPETQLDFFKF